MDEQPVHVRQHVRRRQRPQARHHASRGSLLAAHHPVTHEHGRRLQQLLRALRHVSGIEVACNLLGGGVTEPAVLAAVRALAEAAGLALGGGYRTNKAPEELVAAAMAAGL